GQLAGTFNPTNRSGDANNGAPLLIGLHQFSSPGYVGLLDDLVIARRVFDESDIEELLDRAPVRVPQRVRLAVETPVAEATYRSELNIVGNYSVDPALIPVTLNVEVMQPTGLAVSLPVEINLESADGEFQFVAGCGNFVVGMTNTLHVNLVDRLNQKHEVPPVSFLFTVADP